MPHGAQFDPVYYPVEEVVYLQTHYPHAHVLNHWNYGGYIIFTARDNLSVFVDGRASIAYPDEVIKDFISLTLEKNQSASWDMALKKYHPDVILWPATTTYVEKILVEEQGWKKVYSGPVANLYARSAP